MSMETIREEAVGRREAEGRPGPGLAPRLRHEVMALRPGGTIFPELPPEALQHLEERSRHHTEDPQV